MKKIGLICLALVLAVGAVGFGYAHWSDQLYVEGTVKGGSLMVGFVDVTCLERVPNPTPPPDYLPVNPDDPTTWGEYLGKNVAKCEVILEDYRYDEHTMKEGFGGVVVTITDAYPCYRVDVTFVIENLGTIPVIFEGVTITSDELVYDPAKAALCDPVTGEPIINFDFVNLIEKQLDYCEKTKAEIDIHIKQEANECDTYSFKVVLDAIQYNKSAYWP